MSSHPRRGLILLTLLAATLGLPAPAAIAAPERPPAAVAATPPPVAESHGTARESKTPTPLKDRGPIPATTPRDSGARSAAACDPAEFAARTGAALVQHIRSSTLDCVNSLFTLTGSTATGAFREAQMVSVAYGLRDNATAYPGDNSTATGQLVLYLRAGYFVQWYNPDVVGSYGPTLRTAIQAALDTFYGNSRAFSVSEANGATLSEAVTLIDSAQENARYLWVVRRLLSSYTSAYDAYPSMVSAVNGVYTVLFRGHYLPAFVSAVQSDPAVIDSLNAFALAHLNLLGTNRAYLTTNAGRELSRFLQHDALRAKVRPLAKGLLDRSSITGPTGGLWIGVAEMADAYDKANCAYYDVCDLAARLNAAILPITHTCSSALRIRAQAITAAELSASCTSLANQDAFFHRVVNDPGPVANDRNTLLEVVVYDSSADYKTYAGTMFDIDTNNGGMYLEGDPAAAGNVPRFIAYEAEWLRPTFEVWNLNHEYTHYLDGRYNMYGDFPTTVSTPTVWWIEGVAEYVSWSYRNLTNTAAIAEAGKKTYTLSTLFDTTYDHDATRVYRWGYLAVRYMMQSHPTDMTTVLGHYRAGNYNAARTYLKSTIGTRYDADWNAWLTACAAGDCGTGNRPPTADFTHTVTGLTAAFTDRSTDTDGTVTTRRWEFGDGGTSTATAPTRTYAAAGTYTVRLTVTDDRGATASTTRSITVTAALPECTTADTRALGKNCQRTNRSAVNSGYDYMYLWVPAGTPQLRINASGGTGNCDLYYSPTNWATTTTATQSSVTSGNNESVVVANPPSGYVYVSLKGSTGCSGVTVGTRY